MGSLPIVLVYPCPGQLPDLVQAPKDVCVEDLLSVGAVEPFDVGVLSRFSRLDELQVNTNLQRDLAAADPRYPVESMDYAQPNQHLVKQLRGLDIEIVDLLPAFRDTAARRRLYKPRDTHWNIAGNALAAELVSQNLVDRTTLLN